MGAAVEASNGALQPTQRSMARRPVDGRRQADLFGAHPPLPSAKSYPRRFVVIAPDSRVRPLSISPRRRQPHAGEVPAGQAHTLEFHFRRRGIHFRRECGINQKQTQE